MPDEQKVCIDCNIDFIYSERDQEFFAEQNYSPPKRCKTCAKKRRDDLGKPPRENERSREERRDKYETQ